VTLDGGKTWSTQYNQATAELYQVSRIIRQFLFPAFHLEEAQVDTLPYGSRTEAVRQGRLFLNPAILI
jgi:hypothetical protein